MSYFTALLVAAGLPASATFGFVPTTTPAATVTPPPAAVSFRTPVTPVTVSQAYYTMQQVGSAFPSTPSTPSTPPQSPGASSGSSSTGSGSSSPGSSGSQGSTGSSGSGSLSNTGTSGNSGSSSQSSNTAAYMVSLINQARQQAGLAPYTVNPELTTLAQERAVALANGPFTSDMAQYGWPIQMEQAAGISAQGMGAENIAEAASVSQAFALLMASPPHRSNILNPYETQIGVGVTSWGSGVAISELFIGPSN